MTDISAKTRVEWLRREIGIHDRPITNLMRRLFWKPRTRNLSRLIRPQSGSAVDRLHSLLWSRYSGFDLNAYIFSTSRLGETSLCWRHESVFPTMRRSGD